ncbi:hypothetical protein HMPREF9946_04940 [Acetobacteraceae bacterium AT-5844]|nr:hypothetical protein HMPREF9946_04940 [Acetobacteraceae bacterium AT-5844]
MVAEVAGQLRRHCSLTGWNIHRDAGVHSRRRTRYWLGPGNKLRAVQVISRR